MASFDNLTSIETWAFRSPFENSWISETFARDTDFLTKALQNSIAGGPIDVSPSPETPLQQGGQSVLSSGGSSESETVTNRLARNPPPPSGKISKRKSRASKRSPTMFIAADPANFRQMVQEVTGVRFPAGQAHIGSMVKPEPLRPVGAVNQVQSGCVLPTLDTSAFLLEHHQKVVSPALVAQGGAMGFGPPGVVAEGGGSGLDFDGFASFPTLESWKVM